MPADAFRPRSTSELLDAAIQLLRAHYAGFLALSVIALVPQIAVNTYQVAVLAPQYADRSVLYVLPLMTVALLWFVIGDAALVVAASDAYLGAGIEPRKALRHALRRSGVVVGSAILKYLFIGLGLLVVMIAASLAAAIVAAIIVGIISAVGGGGFGSAGGSTFTVILGMVVAVLFSIASAWWTLFTVARLFAYRVSIMIEGLGASASLRRSWSLARGDAVKVLLTFLLLYVIYAAVWLLVFTIALFASGRSTVVAQTTASVIALFIYPLIPIVTTLLYYDLRIRKEGYDIELMAGELDAGSGARGSGLGKASWATGLSSHEPLPSPEPQAPSP